MGFYPFIFLMKNRSELQIGFEAPERGLYFPDGVVNVPKFVLTWVLITGADKVNTFFCICFLFIKLIEAELNLRIGEFSKKIRLCDLLIKSFKIEYYALSLVKVTINYFVFMNVFLLSDSHLEKSLFAFIPISF